MQSLPKSAVQEEELESLRFYYLGKQYENKIEHFGCKEAYRPEEPLII